MCLVESTAVKVLEWIENLTPRFPEHVIYKIIARQTAPTILS